MSDTGRSRRVIGFHRIIVYVRNTVSPVYGALLLIQQLARMDEEMRRSATSTLPTRLATELWQARTGRAPGRSPANGLVTAPRLT